MTTQHEPLLSQILEQGPVTLEENFFQGKGLVLYGAGRLGDLAIDIMRGSELAPEYFIDKNAGQKPVLHGFDVYPLQKLQDLDPDAQIVLICAFKYPYEEIKKQIREYTRAEIYSIYDLFFFLEGACFTNGWQTGPLGSEDIAGIENVHDRLSDNRSRQAYRSFLSWRIARREITASSQGIIDEGEKYVNHLTLDALNRSGIVIDAGAFDLSFSLDVLKVQNPPKKIYAFEPDNESFEMCRTVAKTKGLTGRLSLSPMAVCDRNGLGPFVHGHGLASRLTDGRHGQPVSTCTLDGFYEDLETEEPITAIKLHVEGHELESLEGAQNIISRHRPLILVNCSHNRDGLWKLPHFCMGYDGYRFYMRCHAYYGEGLTFYAVPEL